MMRRYYRPCILDRDNITPKWAKIGFWGIKTVAIAMFLALQRPCYISRSTVFCDAKILWDVRLGKKYFESFFRGNVMQKTNKQTKQQNFEKHCDTQIKSFFLSVR